jgi:hypothetical protein
MPRYAQLADNSPSPSNTLHLSGDNWELSGWSLSWLQPTVIVEIIAPTLAPVKAGELVQNESAGCLESGAQP